MAITDPFIHPQQKREVNKIHRKYAKREAAIDDLGLDEAEVAKAKKKQFSLYKEEIVAFYTAITGKETFEEEEPEKKPKKKSVRKKTITAGDLA